MIRSKIDNIKVNFVEGDTDPRNYRVDFTKLEKNFYSSLILTYQTVFKKSLIIRIYF